jgi:hypothetical protein
VAHASRSSSREAGRGLRGVDVVGAIVFALEMALLAALPEVRRIAVSFVLVAMVDVHSSGCIK